MKFFLGYSSKLQLITVVILLLISSSLPGQDLLLNEYLPYNTNGLVDEDNDSVSWLEIFNNSGSSKNLQGYGLSNDLYQPFKFTFPAAPIKTGRYMLFFVSGKSDRLKPVKWRTLVDKGAVWKYFEGFSEPPSGWVSEEFDDSAWSEGQSGFGYGDDDDATKISNVNSVFVRKKIQIDDVDNLSMLVLNVDYDDSFVAYINGKEFARANIGTIGVMPKHDDVADNSAHEAGIYRGMKPESFFIRDIKNMLHNGENTLALQVHNAGTSSTDLTLIPMLSAVYKYSEPAGSTTSVYLPDLPIGIHIDFVPGKSADTLYLCNPQGTLVDKLEYMGIPKNRSIGRSGSQKQIFMIFDIATPGALNSTSGSTYFPFAKSHLPLFIINTSDQVIHDTVKIIADMGVINNPVGVENNITDTFTDYNGKIGIEIRGSTSAGFPKKQYSIETRDDAGDDVEAELLGFPDESDWILHAPYSDKSLIRNVFVYTLSRKIGRYATRTKFCELVLNDEYMGLYVLMEKIKRDNGRVNISKLEPENIEGEDLTGGYIIKLDKDTGEGNEGWQSDFSRYGGRNSSLYYQYHYPKPEDMVDQQKSYIKSFMYNFESVLASSSFRDSIAGYRKFIDVDSFIDHFILVELSKNIDGYRLSTFMYKDKDSKGGLLNMGPIWDYNLAFGNANYDDGDLTEGWQYNWHGGYEYTSVPFWWKRLLQDQNFCDRLKTRWVRLRETTLNWDTLNDNIDSLVSAIGAAEERNFTRWPILDEYVWPNVMWNTTYQEEVSYVKNWLKKRLTWLDDKMPGRLITGIETDGKSVPEEFALMQNYPNPFNPVTNIEYHIPSSEYVNISVIDILGREVEVIVDEIKTPGKYTVNFDGSDLASGIYFYKISAGSFSAVKKFTLVK